MTFNLRGLDYVARPPAIRPLDEHPPAARGTSMLPLTKAHSRYLLGGQLSSELTTHSRAPANCRKRLITNFDDDAGKNVVPKAFVRLFVPTKASPV